MLPNLHEGRRDQDKFYTVYRDRQSWLHHLAYMRTGKIKAGELLLRRNALRLADLSVFEFGFGAGTMLRRCATSCRIAGLELDEENAVAVRDMLRRRGHDTSGIATCSIEGWVFHSLLDYARKYDVIILSHVLEHMADPVGMLRRLKLNLSAGGRMLVIVPLNEIKVDEDHKWRCDFDMVSNWISDAGLDATDSAEVDHWMYWIGPIAQSKTRAGRLVWQSISVVLGLAQSVFSPDRWFALGRVVGGATGAKPAQGVFLIQATPTDGRTAVPPRQLAPRRSGPEDPERALEASPIVRPGSASLPAGLTGGSTTRTRSHWASVSCRHAMR